MKNVKNAVTVAAGIVALVVASPSAMALALEKKQTTAQTFKRPAAEKSSSAHTAG